jgi:hypothetical protein
LDALQAKILKMLSEKSLGTIRGIACRLGLVWVRMVWSSIKPQFWKSTIPAKWSLTGRLRRSLAMASTLVWNAQKQFENITDSLVDHGTNYPPTERTS